MHKKVLLALVLVMAMLLSGCALIEKDLEVDRATEVIRVGDSVFTKGQILDETDYQLSMMSYYYSMFGMAYDVTDPTVIADTQQSVIDGLVETAVSQAKVKELGLDTLTAEEQAQVDANVEEAYRSNLESVQSAYFADTELTGDELTAALEAKSEELGMTREYLKEYETNSFLSEKLYNHIIADVTVSEDELQAAFNDEVTAAQENYAADLTAYADDLDYGSTIYYRPAGYRMVKQILVGFTDEDQAIIDELNALGSEQATLVSSYTTSLNSFGADTEALLAQVTTTVEPSADAATQAATVTSTTAFPEDTEESVAEQVQLLAEAKALQAYYAEKLEAAEATAFANIDAEADDVIAQLAAGADWDTLMAEKTDDPGMQEGAATAETGYAVCLGMTNMDEPFLKAAMALDNVGDVSPKTAGLYGYYIVQYTSEVEEGPVALDEVREALTSSLLSEKQDTVYTETLDKWVEEAKPSIDYKALEDN